MVLQIQMALLNFAKEEKLDLQPRIAAGACRSQKFPPQTLTRLIENVST